MISGSQICARLVVYKYCPLGQNIHFPSGFCLAKHERVRPNRHLGTPHIVAVHIQVTLEKIKEWSRRGYASYFGTLGTAQLKWIGVPLHTSDNLA